MTRKKDLGFINGLMGVNMKVGGTKVNSMGSENILALIKKIAKDNQ